MNLEKAIELQNQLKTTIRDLKKIEKLKERENSFDFNNSTERQRDKVREDLNWAFMDIEKQKYELHALSVELGVADLRDNDYYQDVVFRPSGWHEFKYVPRKPK